MKQIAVLSGKGGTGKTSIAAAFACINKNNVVVDCDVDASNMHLVLYPDIKESGNFNCGSFAFIDLNKCTKCNKCRQVCRFEAIDKDFIIDKSSCEGCGVCVWNCPQKAISLKNDMSGRWFVSDTRFGPMVHAELGLSRENSGKLVSYIRDKARNISKQKNIKTIIIDGPPGIGCPAIASVSGVDKALLVSEPSLSAMHDLKRALELISKFGIKTFVCVNRFDLNIEITKEIKNLCLKEKCIFAGEVSYNDIFVKAISEAKTIAEYGQNAIIEEIKNIWENILFN